ncbi:MAG TPA: AtpZ/AtpI family protein [Candidatus Polarisedimenticolaceae bacterium]|nr:AtpZ/AtpI family protein [Candidatus Polarisedimenticolaceae bacterium]
MRRPEGPSPLEFAGLGFELVVPLMVGLFGGQWLDRRFGTTPWLVLTGALLGAAAGMLNLYRRVVPPKGPGPGGSA